MSQRDHTEKNDKNEKKNKKEKKNKADTKYNKSDEELKILNDLANEWSLEPFRSPNKEKICLKYLQILEDHNFTNYKLEELKQYCNNHRKKVSKLKDAPNGVINRQQPFYQQQSLPPNQEMLNQMQNPPNQAFYQQAMLQQPGMIQQQTSQTFTPQNSLQQLSNQAFPQPPTPQQHSTTLPYVQPQQQPLSTGQPFNQPQISSNQSFTQQSILPTQMQQQISFNQSYIQNQPFSTNQVYPQQTINNQNYQQQMIQATTNQQYAQQQQPSFLQPSFIQTSSQTILPNQTFTQQQNLQQQEQENQQSNSESLQNQPSITSEDRTDSSEIRLPSDFFTFGSSDNSQLISRVNSESSDANAASCQLQSSSTLVASKIPASNESSQIQTPRDSNQAQTSEEEPINIDRNDNQESEIISSDIKKKIEDESSMSKEIENEFAHNNNNDYEYDDESDSEDDNNSDLDDDVINVDKKSAVEKNDDNLKKHIVLDGHQGGKHVGKSYYFPSDTYYTSYSSSSTSPLTVSLPYKLKSSADKTHSNDLIKKIPDIPVIQGELNNETLDSMKSDIYRSIKLCYRYIHESADIYSQKPSPEKKIVFNENLFNFQKEIEEKFVSFTSILTNVLNIDQIGSRDQSCEHIDIKSKKHLLSTTTRIYSGEDLPDSSSQISPINSSFTTDKSKDDIKDKSKDDIKDESKKTVKFDDKIIYNDKGKIGLADCTISSYIFNIKRFNVNEKLSSFYLGKYSDETRYSIDISDVEVSDIISYSHKSENGNEDIIVCEYAYVNYYFNSHVLNLKGAKCETGFFSPVHSMHFHRVNNVNKIYLCGDVRVKEFIINGLDNDEEVTIENTNTFYFGISDYQSSAVTLWDKEVVLGVESKIFFWNVEDEFNIRKGKETIDTRENKKLVKQSGIDQTKIDWTRGKNSRINPINITTEGMQQITSLAVIGDPDGESYLAVASINYPVIYIFDKEHQNVSRLVSHTMGITCLKSFNYNLFSGSLDLVARLWDVNQGAPILWCNTKCQKIFSIEPAIYCGKMILFTGGKDNAIQCFSITDKKPLFEIKLNENLVPKEISFVAGKNIKYGDFAKLMIISEYMNQDSLTSIKKCQVHYFEFI